MTSEQQAYEGEWLHCEDCGVRRPINTLSREWVCLDSDWCARHALNKCSECGHWVESGNRAGPKKSIHEECKPLARKTSRQVMRLARLRRKADALAARLRMAGKIREAGR